MELQRLLGRKMATTVGERRRRWRVEDQQRSRREATRSVVPRSLPAVATSRQALHRPPRRPKSCCGRALDNSAPIPAPATHFGEIALDISPPGTSEASPSRSELLSMVKKHSHLIGWMVVEAVDDASDVGMDDKFWHEMLDLFFVRGRVSMRREEDAVAFFVNNMKMQGFGFNDKMEDLPPFFVRRWVPMVNEATLNLLYFR